MTVLTLRRWNISIGSDQPLVIIAGLNVLEDLNMALDTASYLQKLTGDLDLSFIFKASFDKANRSSISSYRGPMLEKGLTMLLEVKRQLNVPIATDVHDERQAEAIAAVADMVQIPAFLCRQTDIVTAAARAAHRAGGLLHVKKGQFLAPWDCKNIISKINEATGAGNITILCERGSSFGYNNLVVDMLSISEMKKLGVPVTIDATHAVQLPGADYRTAGISTGGRRDGVSTIARAAVAAGADGVFLEFHPDPDRAFCDGPSCLPLDSAAKLLMSLKALHAALCSQQY